jgi:hypothetical protein
MLIPEMLSDFLSLEAQNGLSHYGIREVSEDIFKFVPVKTGKRIGGFSFLVFL